MNIPSLLPSLLLLFTLTTFSLAGSAVTEAPAAVLDTFGKPLRVGFKYYVQQPPSNPYNHTGLYVGMLTGKECPMVVEVAAQYIGYTVSFTPVNNKKGVVRVSTDLNVAFNKESFCDDSNVWKVDYHASTRLWFVYTNGSVGKPGRETVRNWFKIEKYEDGYKFVYCPSVCKECKVQCEDIGLYWDEPSESECFVLSRNKPYKVQFVQAAS